LKFLTCYNKHLTQIRVSLSCHIDETWWANHEHDLNPGQVTHLTNELRNWIQLYPHSLGRSHVDSINVIRHSSILFHSCTLSTHQNIYIIRNSIVTHSKNFFRMHIHSSFICTNLHWILLELFHHKLGNFIFSYGEVTVTSGVQEGRVTMSHTFRTSSAVLPNLYPHGHKYRNPYLRPKLIGRFILGIVLMTTQYVKPIPFSGLDYATWVHEE